MCGGKRVDHTEPRNAERNAKTNTRYAIDSCSLAPSATPNDRDSAAGTLPTTAEASPFQHP